MRPNYRFLLMLLIMVVLPLSSSRAQMLQVEMPEDVGISSRRLARLEQVMQSYVDRNHVAGIVTLIARQGELAHLKAFGMADREAGKRMTTDTIFRIASMSKAITSVAVMMLYEEGRFLLTDPVSKYIPEFKDMQVLVLNEEGAPQPYRLEPAKQPITIRHLLMHTSGLTYGFFGRPHIADMYKKAGVSDGLIQTEGTIGEGVRKLAALPLISQPGEAWEYGLSTDVLGYFVEVISGMPFDKFLRDRLFNPLDMKDTFFFTPAEKQGRLAAVYTPDGAGGIKRLPEDRQVMGPVVFSTSYHYKGPRTYFSGGAGLASTVMDYARFLQMLLNGGELDDARILSPTTVELMTADQLGDDMPFAPGSGFGLGFGVSKGPGATGQAGSAGAYSWGGFFNTSFWVDPEEDMIGVIMTQRYPGAGTDVTSKFRVMVYQAIIE